MDLCKIETIKVRTSSISSLQIKNFSAYALSPLRYPGGKTWFTNYSNAWLGLQPSNRLTLVEPFAGGASVSLAALKNNLVDSIHLAETDDGVAAFWKTILSGQGPQLVDRILNFKPNRKNVTQIIEERTSKRIDLAFKTLIKNRFCFGGILANGVGLPKKGELDKGLVQRWYPETISKRIECVDQARERIKFFDGCGLSLIQTHRKKKNSVLFLDPPYLQDGRNGRNAGRRIYNRKEMCVYHLMDRMMDFGPKFLMTYHLSSEVAQKALDAGLELSLIPMKSSHHFAHQEMVITNDAAWEFVATWTGK